MFIDVNVEDNMKNTNFYIFTGGPGSGKTTVLNCLKAKGYLTIEESGRKIIQNQIKSNGTALPWNDTVRYARLMFLYALTDYEENVHLDQKCFFDRGIIDILGYCRLINIPLPAGLAEAAKKYCYNKKVFLFPFWSEIYENDTERKQDKKEAEKTYNIMKDTYEEFGYQPVIVPCISPEERVQWILENL